MDIIAAELLIHARQITRTPPGLPYEFILNEKLEVIECVKIQSLIKGIIIPVKEIRNTLAGMLFDLHHVRVNPKWDNSLIISRLIEALNEIGVTVSNQPKADSMSICFKPLGEISSHVRFYLNAEQKLIFLSPAMRPRLIYSKH